MKRLSSITIKSSDIKPNALTKVVRGGYTFYAYSHKQYHYEKVYLVRSDIELPYVDVYECRAMAKTGSMCGYVFDVFCKDARVEDNFIIAVSKSFNLSVTDIIKQKNYLKLNYKIRGCNIYTLGAYATLITISNNPKMKAKMEM